MIPIRYLLSREYSLIFVETVMRITVLQTIHQSHMTILIFSPFYSSSLSRSIPNPNHIAIPNSGVSRFQIMKRRQDLKIVVMSATLDALKFQQYFDNAPLMKVRGGEK